MLDSTMLLKTDTHARFNEQGYLGPLTVLSKEEARQSLALLQRVKEQPSWYKGYAAVSENYYRIATHPKVLDVLRQLLGPDFYLWGASLVIREPGHHHPWHTDVETANEYGRDAAEPPRTVSVWLGLEGVTVDSSLQVISQSHKLDGSTQEYSHNLGIARKEATPELVLSWAQRKLPEARIDQIDMTDGQAVFFDGRLWHGTDNTSRYTRTALLLQYATPDKKLLVPNEFEWPFGYDATAKPPCLLVAGQDNFMVNTMVAVPPGVETLSWVEKLELPLTEDTEVGWKPYYLFAGTTRTMLHLTCHASVLSAGKTPHPPHTHDEEEILIVLEGKPTLIVERNDQLEELTTTPGATIYYPAQQRHTIRNNADKPVTYLMFKWQGGATAATEADPETSQLPLSYIDAGTTSMPVEQQSRHILLQGKTEYLTKLQVHKTQLPLGEGYEPHTDPYDVALIVLKGKVEVLGKQVTTGGVVFCAAGEPHGMKNTGVVEAEYLVIEFHGFHNEKSGHQRSSLRQRMKRLLPQTLYQPARRGFRFIRSIVK